MNTNDLLHYRPAIITESNVDNIDFVVHDIRPFCTPGGAYPSWSVSVGASVYQGQGIAVGGVALDARGYIPGASRAYVGLPIFFIRAVRKYLKDKLGIEVKDTTESNLVTQNYLWTFTNLYHLTALVVGSGTGTKAGVRPLLESLSRVSMNPVGVGIAYLRLRCATRDDMSINKLKNYTWELHATLMSLNTFEYVTEGPEPPKPAKDLITALRSLADTSTTCDSDD